MSSGHNKRMKMTPGKKDSAGPGNIFQMLCNREIGICTSYLAGDRWCCKVRSDQGGHRCVKLSREELSGVRRCAFCDGEYRNYGDDASVRPTLSIPRITDDDVLRFFMLINRQNWTHVICRGLGVTTHDDLLRLRPEQITQFTLRQNDAYPTELLSLITLEDRNYFRLKLRGHQQKHAAG